MRKTQNISSCSVAGKTNSRRHLDMASRGQVGGTCNLHPALVCLSCWSKFQGCNRQTRPFSAALVCFRRDCSVIRSLFADNWASIAVRRMGSKFPDPTEKLCSPSTADFSPGDSMNKRRIGGSRLIGNVICYQNHHVATLNICLHLNQRPTVPVPFEVYESSLKTSNWPLPCFCSYGSLCSLRSCPATWVIE